MPLSAVIHIVFIFFFIRSLQNDGHMFQKLRLPFGDHDWVDFKLLGKIWQCLVDI
jgi:hypothetical protein